MKKIAVLLVILMTTFLSSFLIYAEELNSNMVVTVTDDKLEAVFLNEGVTLTIENNTFYVDGVIIDDSEMSEPNPAEEEEFNKIAGWGAHRLINEMSFSDNVREIKSSFGIILLRRIDKISFGKNVTIIGDDIFSKCRITEIDFPESLSSIGSSAFKSCELLDNLTIPENVKNIGDNAFADCTTLNDITVLSQDVIISASAFINGSENFVNSDRIIRGYQNSTAEKYAHENGFQFIPLNDTTIVTTEVTTESSDFNTESTTVSTMNVKQTISDTTIVTSKSENNTNSHVGGTPETGENNISGVFLTCISAVFLSVISSRQKSNLNQK